MNKIIIKIDDSIDELTAMAAVTQVMKMGRVSETKHGQSFCFATLFENGLVVYCDKSKTGTDIIRVSRRGD